MFVCNGQKTIQKIMFKQNRHTFDYRLLNEQVNIEKNILFINFHGCN